MGNKNAQGRRLSARRAATFLAALGALVMSSGIALMVVATPANAAANDCVPQQAYTETTDWVAESPGEGWYQVDERQVLVTPPTDAVYGPGQRYSWNPQGPYDESSPAPTYPNPTQGTWIANTAAYSPGHVGEPIGVPFEQASGNGGNNSSWYYWTRVVVIPASDAVYRTEYKFAFDHPAVTCDVEKAVLTPQAPTFTPATCTSDASVTLPQQAPQEFSRTAADPSLGSSDVDGVHYVASGSLAPGGTVVVDATLIDSSTTEFADGAKTSWTFPVAAPTGCTTQVSPPTTQTESQVVVKTPKTKTTKTNSTVTPTVVEAGLVSTSVQDLRGEQGLALMVAGMVMLVAAGGLGLRVRGAAARI